MTRNCSSGSNRHRILVTALLALAASFTGVALAASDSDLQREVAERLRATPQLTGTTFAVSVKRGGVTISGSVDRLWRVWRAREIASKVHGVRGVTTAVRVTPTARSDADLRHEVERSLATRTRLSTADLRVSASNGIVTIAGTVRDARARFDARDAAAEVRGVHDVIDEIESPSQDDAVIERALVAGFSGATLKPLPGRFEVGVKDGVVTLRGTAPRLFERDQAVRRALGVNGVHAVVDEIKIEPRSDEVPTSRISDETDQEPLVQRP